MRGIDLVCMLGKLFVGVLGNVLFVVLIILSAPSKQAAPNLEDL